MVVRLVALTVCPMPSSYVCLTKQLPTFQRGGMKLIKRQEGFAARTEARGLPGLGIDFGGQIVAFAFLHGGSVGIFEVFIG